MRIEKGVENVENRPGNINLLINGEQVPFVFQCLPSAKNLTTSYLGKQRLNNKKHFGKNNMGD